MVITMKIHGLNKTTLLDFPGHLAATIFLGHCNFRCPFCHNGGLVLAPDSQPTIPVEEVLAFLKKRRGILEGVCITGGEPTLQPELPEFIKEIKDMGYLVKLDTNGYRPQVLQSLCEAGLLDMVAMDIKSSKENYSKVSGIPNMDLSRIRQSVEYLMQGNVPYEFRTTVVKELHSEEDFVSIGQWIGGCTGYYLQAYKESPEILGGQFTSYSLEELKSFKNILKKTIDKVEIRGLDE